MRRFFFAAFAFSLGGVLLACSTSDSNVGIDVTTGQETDAFADAGVTKVTVSVTSPIDSTLNLSATSVSPDGGTFDFGTITDTEQITVTATGYNEHGNPVMLGSSLAGLLLSAISGDIAVFIQQTNQWARPPGGLACSHIGGVASVQEDRAFILTGGELPDAGNASGCDATGIDTYDMFGLGGDVPTPAYGDVPETIVSLLPSDNSTDAQGLFISASSGFFWDYDTGQQNTACPAGFTAWSTVAGGAVIQGDTGTGSTTDTVEWFVVGGTRPSGRTTGVLEVGPDCTTSGLTLTTPRAGAAAAWFEGTGLVVAGGQAPGDQNFGLEILEESLLADGTATFTGQAGCGADETVGAALVQENNGFARIGGMLKGAPAPTVHFNVTGSDSSCSPTGYAVADGGTPLPALTNTSAFQLNQASTNWLIVGTDASGMTVTFIVNFSSPPTIVVTPVPLREPRRGATAIAGPTGAIGMLGGVHADGSPATSIELFVPSP